MCVSHTHTHRRQQKEGKQPFSRLRIHNPEGQEMPPVLDRNCAQGTPAPGTISSHGGPQQQRTHRPASPPPCLHASRRGWGAHPGSPGVAEGSAWPLSSGARNSILASHQALGCCGWSVCSFIANRSAPWCLIFFFKVRDTVEKKMVTFPARKKKVREHTRFLCAVSRSPENLWNHL